MPEKDPLSYSWLTYGWVIGLSMVGGFVSFHRKILEGSAKVYNLMAFLGELVTAGFAGVLTFWLCEAGAIDPLTSAVLVGISGHMGSRLILQIELWLTRRFPGRDEDDFPPGGVA